MVRIADGEVGHGGSCYVIGEIGLNHNGDTTLAKKLIDVAVASGCDAVKFQKRDVAGLAIESVLDAEDKRFPEFGSTYREIREHLEFDREQYVDLMAYARERGTTFICTAFDIPSVEFLESLNLETYKLASHSLTNTPLLKYVAGLGKPTILSTGMATLEEVDQAVAVFKETSTPLVLLHCVSSYPTPPEECNLTMIDVYRERYGIPVGYSGHEMGWLPTVAAVARGACMVERHITLDNGMVGFDHKLSLTPDELGKMVADIRSVEKMLGDGRKHVSDKERITRDKYHVSWVSQRAICAGDVITEDMLTLKNPGTGIPAYRKDLIIGKRALMDIGRDTLIELSMME
jgi:sialic acid synthase SpsE